MPISAPSARPGAARWRIALLGTLLQAVLGTIYAWSFFQKPLMEFAHWNNQQVAWTLSLAICCLGLGATLGGLLLPRQGPRRLALLGAALYPLGFAIGAAALHIKSLPLLYLGLGGIGGLGLGLGYVTPVATVARWFPDRKGLVTGMVVMGFGLGAWIMSQVLGPWAISWATTVGAAGTLMVAWPKVFLVLALLLAGPGLVAAWAMVNPSGTAHGGQGAMGEQEGKTPRTPSEAILSLRFALLWAVFFCNITAGIMFIGFQSPLIQDLYQRTDPLMTPAELAAAGAALIAVSSLFNALGRILWGALSDRIGRTTTFRLLLGSQLLVFLLLTRVSSPLLFGLLVCYILLCYGGGFGTAPAFVLTLFGGRVMGPVYGMLLTAWSLAGLVGPQVVAVVKDRFGTDPALAARQVFILGAVILALGYALSFTLRDRPLRSRD